MEKTKKNLMLFVLLQNLTKTGNQVASIAKVETNENKLIRELNEILKFANHEFTSTPINLSDFSLEEIEFAQMLFSILDFIVEPTFSVLFKELNLYQKEIINEEYNIFIDNLEFLKNGFDTYIDNTLDKDNIKLWGNFKENNKDIELTNFDKKTFISLAEAEQIQKGQRKVQTLTDLLNEN